MLNGLKHGCFVLTLQSNDAKQAKTIT